MNVKTEYVHFKEEIMKKYLLVVYGKDGCPHCVELQRKVKEVLKNYSDAFSVDIQNLSTKNGLIAYAKAETVNGQRIPALQIFKYNEDACVYEKIVDKRDELFNKQGGSCFYPTYLQLETDYANHKTIQNHEIEELISVAMRSN